MILVHSTHTWLPLTEQWIYRQVKHITGMQQIVVCDKKDATMEELVQTYYNPQSLYSLSNRVRNKLGMSDRFRSKILEIYNTPILFSHFGIQGFRDLQLKKKKHITRFYGYDLTRTLKSDRRWKNRYEKLFDECDTFIVEGPSMKTTLTSLGCPENKINISYLGTEVADIPFSPRKENDTLNVLIACATAERKGIIYALKALEKAIRQYKIPIHIHWVGARNSDYIEYVKYEKLLNDFIAASNLQPHITRYGFLPQKELQVIARKCEIAIHPSVWAADGDCEGGYPVVLIDLMASGLPVISTTHCDIPEVVTNENGYLCPEKNVDALTEALVDAYQENTYIKKSVAARITTEKKFDWDILGLELTMIIGH